MLFVSSARFFRTMKALQFSLILLALSMAAGGLSPAADLGRLALEAVTENPDAIAQLRASGPVGLDALMREHKTAVEELRAGRMALDGPDAAGLRSALDGVARQRDAFASGLYWFTDMQAAQEEAKRTGRRILSLRLLGNLDEEYSCANSRFFRTVLYANAEVATELRAHYVLHWKSVRPVPRITIDMGDGRRIQRTITGNSIHYVLDETGRVIDAIPGLVGPKAFLASLDRARQADREHLSAWHGGEANRLCTEWLRDALQVGAYGLNPDQRRNPDLVESMRPFAFPPSELPPPPNFFPVKPSDGQPISDTKKANPAGETNARQQKTSLAGADDRQQRSPTTKTVRVSKTARKPDAFRPPAVGKSMVERPILKQVMPEQLARAADDATAPPKADARRFPPLIEAMTPALWKSVAGLHGDETRLDAASRRFMMAKLPKESLTTAERKTGSVTDGETPFARTLRRFEQAVAEDTVRNEYLMHTQIHQWLEVPAGGALSRDVEALNKKVYAELFLTPDYDEWLGLVPEDTYTALEKDGCACDKGAPPMVQRAQR